MRIESCTLCPHECKALRTESEGTGLCKMGANAVAARAALHFWEEPCISGTMGSGTVFFTGCSLQCVFCQNYAISTSREAGKILSLHQLTEVFKRLEEQGAHNINLVNPTHFAAAIIEALHLYKPKVPVVYNSGGYERVETLRALEGLVDIYLPDFKYATAELAQRYANAPNYPEAAKSAILEMSRQTGPAVFSKDGIMTRGTLVRHLILPGNTRNSMACLSWLAENLTGTPVSLMGQYIPCGRAAEFAELSRRITKREYEKVQDYLFSLGLDGFVQELSSAKKEYVPDFDLTGIT